ncbi:type VI secretion system baseplate subunit TssG [Fulvimarina sp. MAC3]|uniref:type VI secretion system baseplate subunit TssG n=1 Tax=Fulvimarina sp. MAC3 TaxID=3148887 RepID=UPI0031FE05B2
MTRRDELEANPTVHDLFSILREIEKATPDQPRIGRSETRRADVVSLGQDPFLEFPLSTIESFEMREGIPHLNTRFLGFFGPQGALPLTTSVDAMEWSRGRDPSFVRFTELFSNRFLQFFFRAWSDARAITQHDRPDHDRFVDYFGSFLGIGTKASSNRDSIPDEIKLPYSGLADGRVKTATKLQRFLRGLLHTDVEIIERIGSWLEFDQIQRSAIGVSGMRIGDDAYLGSRAYTINEKIRIRLKTETLESYESLLPGGELCDRLTDICFLYMGHRFEFDVELGLKADQAPPVRLGESGALGLTSWIDPKARVEKGETYFYDARFAPLEIRMNAADEAPPNDKD